MTRQSERQKVWSAGWRPTPSLLAKVADELRRNDECGPGPLSDDEYMDDARAILRIVEEHDKGGSEVEYVPADSAAVERATSAAMDAIVESYDVIAPGDEPYPGWALRLAERAVAAAFKAAGTRGRMQTLVEVERLRAWIEEEGVECPSRSTVAEVLRRSRERVPSPTRGR